MIIGCIIWMICLELNWFFYDPSWILQLSEFVWTHRSSVWVVFNNFLLINATDRSKISSNHHRIFFAVSLYLLSLFANGVLNDAKLKLGYLYNLDCESQINFRFSWWYINILGDMCIYLRDFLFYHFKV